MDLVHYNMVDLLRLLASVERQDEYQAAVAVVPVDIAGELRCMWFDDLYHPGPGFDEAFTERERRELAEFHAHYEALEPELPKRYQEMRVSAAWQSVVARAGEAVAALGWGEGASPSGNGLGDGAT